MKSNLTPVATLLLFTCLQNYVNAASPAPTPDQQRIRVLVELLASPNAISGNSCDFPKGYDRNAQVVVYLAVQQLLAEGATGFDTLIEHFNDNRYSYTYAAADGEYHSTVGDACSLIMWRCIACYANEIHIITEEQFRLPPDFSKEKASAWWKHNRRRPLWEIQIDSIDHAIALMETVRHDKTRLPWRFAEYLTPEVFESRRKDNLRILKEMRASIVAHKEAYRPKSLKKWLDDQYEPMLGLPWPTNPNRY